MPADLFSILQRGLTHIIFPAVCHGCGQPVPKTQPLCSFCVENKFEQANPDCKPSASGILLPHKVRIQQALWKFYKGDILQRLLHRLKYEGLKELGVQMGRHLGKNAQNHPHIQLLLALREALLLPVPLHYLKFKKRGFNQAFSIARGVEQALGIPICAIDTVRRSKYTQSQTCFSLDERRVNMDGAFKVKKPEDIQQKVAIIIDDVFTTGSTSFELAKNLRQAGAAAIMIWTVAQA